MERRCFAFACRRARSLPAAGSVARCASALADDILIGRGDLGVRRALPGHAGALRVGPQRVKKLLDGDEVGLGVEFDNVVMPRALDDVGLAAVGLGCAAIELDRVGAVHSLVVSAVHEQYGAGGPLDAVHVREGVAQPVDTRGRAEACQKN